jgi:hypothetical protein
MKINRRACRAHARLSVVLLAVAAAGITDCAAAQTPSATVPGYADLVDLTLASPIIARATIDKTVALTVAEAGPVPAGKVNVLVTASANTALRAPGDISTQLTYIWNSPADAKGRAPKAKGVPVLVFLRGVAGRPDQVQLVSPRAQLPWTDATEAMVRRILAEANSGKVPVVTGVATAFRVPGGVPGEAESQFFLTTADGKPVSLVLLTRPGEAQRLSVALGDVIDDSAGGVRHDTLLWYRLACFLPPQLPAGVGADDRAGVEADYASVLKILGPCTRTSSAG